MDVGGRVSGWEVGVGGGGGGKYTLMRGSLYVTVINHCPQGSVDGGGCREVKVSFAPPKGERVGTTHLTTLHTVHSVHVHFMFS